MNLGTNGPELYPPGRRILFESPTNDLLLKQIVQDDAGAIYDLLVADEELLKATWFVDGVEFPRSVDDVRRAIMSPRPGMLNFGIWSDDDTLVGRIDITPKNDVGYLVGSQHGGNSYGARAVKALMKWMEESRGAHFFTAYGVVAGNIASARTLQKAGFKLTETLIEEGEKIHRWNFERDTRWPLVGEQPALKRIGADDTGEELALDGMTEPEPSGDGIHTYLVKSGVASFVVGRAFHLLEAGESVQIAPSTPYQLLGNGVLLVKS